MKIMIKIGMILTVLLSMVGFASAGADMYVGPALDLNTAPGGTVVWDVHVEVTDDDGSSTALQTIEFDTRSSELTGVLESADATTAALVTTTSTDPTLSGQTGMIEWQPTEAGTYNFKYTVDVTPTPSTYNYPQILYATGILVDYKSPSVNISLNVPEFPAIALPVAAILGLAFIFQRRREEE